MLLLAALGTDTRIWDGVAARLAGGTALLRIEHPGHGGAPTEDARSVAQLAARVLRTLDDAGIASAHVAGVSLGAAVALALAADHPGRVRSLTLAHTALRFGDPALWDRRIETARRDGLAPLVEGTLARWLTPGEATADPGRADGLRAMFIATDREAYARCCEAVRDFDGEALPARVRAPTLLVAGDADLATPPAQMLALQQALPRAQLLRLPGAHLGLLAAPGAVAGALQALIDEGDHLWTTT
ncbi:beta-ketoadipate enol-lactone hydrolase [Piscinibacter sakaiensis]|uniref:Beta-ketoadipate enol-lactone hydrolase n=1 Tax=Piscinibacter sakaiensis TaxID=1547922 RepID=A0A0K8P233_PISS1|nr:beta-ketoadipate enol-lactone hydrolase [Piscinibacter sakaiensis]